MRFWLEYAVYWLNQNLYELPRYLAWAVLFAFYLYHIRWTYLDAQRRYNKGAYWAIFVALVPAMGFAVYLAYRRSPLVEYDLAEEEMALWGSSELEEFKRQKTLERRREIIRDLKRRVRRLGSRIDEKYLAPVLALVDMERHSKALSQFLSRQSEKYAPKVRKAGIRVSDAVEEYRSGKDEVEFYRSLKEMPVEDERLEELIYEGQHAEALEIARDNLEIAREQDDRRGINTYERYVERLERILSENAAAESEGGAPEQ